MKRLPLILILLVATFFRIYQLGSVPPSASLDEASIGFNAYSILKIGKDEFGTAFPILLRAYDDFRPALYVYLVAPFVGILGLTPFAVRLPSVLLGVFVVYLTYQIGRLIGFKYFGDDGVGRYASLLVAMSPWHIYLSRLGHEANLGLALLVCGIYFFLRAVLEGDKRALIIGGAMFGLSLHGYQSQKLVTPILMIFGILLFWKDVWRMKRYAVIGGLLAIFIALPAVIATFSPQGMTRLAGTSAIAGKRKLDAVSVIVNNYISHYSPRWLFTGKQREAHKTPGMGLLYIWEAPLLILGFWVFWRSNMPQKLKMLLVVWLLSSPLPAAITTQAPHAMRSFTIVPALAIIEAMGVWFVMKQRIVLFFAGAAATLGLFQFWNGYYVRFPREQSDSFQYAIRPAVAYALKHENEYQRIEFSHQGALYQSYMFYLFYSRFDPKRYLALGGTESGGYEATHYIGKYAFGFIPDRKERAQQEVLYFYDAKHIPEGFRVLRTFSNLDGIPAIIAATL